jgi:plasmid stability protein
VVGGRKDSHHRLHQSLQARHKYGTMARMRTTVDIPDGMYRRLKSRAAREGSSTRALILQGVKEVLKTERRKAGVAVSLPIVPSKRPGTVVIDNAIVYDIAFP